MEKESIKKVHTVMLPPRRVYEDEQEVLTRGVKIKEVKAVTPDMTFRELFIEKMIETSIHIENDNYNINP